METLVSSSVPDFRLAVIGTSILSLIHQINSFETSLTNQINQRSNKHSVIGLSRGDYYADAAAINCEYVLDHAVLINMNHDVVVFSTSTMSLDKVLSDFPIYSLANKLVVDVLSVKMYPHDLKLRCLPSSTDILCTHPMFGP